jgi:hypothetical protein
MISLRGSHGYCVKYKRDERSMPAACAGINWDVVQELLRFLNLFNPAYVILELFPSLLGPATGSVAINGDL